MINKCKFRIWILIYIICKIRINIIYYCQNQQIDYCFKILFLQYKLMTL